MVVETIPLDIFITHILSRYQKQNQPRSYNDGFLSRSDGNRLASTCKYWRQIIKENLAFFVSYHVGSRSHIHTLYIYRNYGCKHVSVHKLDL